MDPKDTCVSCDAPSSSPGDHPLRNSTPVESSFAVFFSRKEDKDPKIELFPFAPTTKTVGSRDPLFDGTIGSERVFAFLRNGVNGPFLGLVGQRHADRRPARSVYYTNIGTANIVTSSTGKPRLMVKLGEQRLFGSVSKRLDQDMLVSLGLNLELQSQKRSTTAQG